MSVQINIPAIKSACVGLGLVNTKTKEILEIHGTGFIIDSTGYIITADHVMDLLTQRKDELQKMDSDIDRVVIMSLLDDKKNFHILCPIITDIRSLELRVKDIQDYLPEEHDIAICRIEGKWERLPSLQLRKPMKLNVFENILICGYPGGIQSLNISDKRFGKRTNPLIQSGKIASIMPNDYTAEPIGLETDIISTGGSSGSPIISQIDGTVIGIIQRSIHTIVADDDGKQIGYSQYGLVWGITFYFLYDGIYKMIEEIKKILDEEGHPIPNRGKDTIGISFKVEDSHIPFSSSVDGKVTQF